MDITCELSIDGVRVADTGADLLGTQPVALDELAVTWGRESVAEQPDVSSCEFTIQDHAGGTHFRDMMHVGSTVSVAATGQIPQGAGTFGADYAVDGSFENTTSATLKNRARANPASALTLRTDGGSAGSKYLRLTETRGAGNAATVDIPPDAFSTAITAWDRIPTADPGAVHRYSIDLRGPASTGGVVDATNLHRNPNLEGGAITYWVTNDATRYPVAVDGTAQLSGTYSCRATRSATSPSTAAASMTLVGHLAGSAIPVSPAVRLYAAVDIKPEFANRRDEVYFQWFDSAGTLISAGVRNQFTTLAANAATRAAATDVPVANTVGCRVVIVVSTTDASMAVANERTWVDRAMVSTTNTAGGYFDGATPAGGGFTYRWTGTANASTSERLTQVYTAAVPVTLRTYLMQPSGAVGVQVDSSNPVLVSGGWQTISKNVAIPTTAQPGQWLGVQLALPSGPTWDTAEGTWDAQNASWNGTVPVVDIDQLRLYPPAVTSRSVLVWSGRISDITAVPLESMSGSRVRVVAVDSFAELANRYVGDQPWPAESMAARFGRIVTLSGASGITYTIDTVPGAMIVCSRDVDNQSSGGLLGELATSTDSVLWFACHTGRGGYLWVENPGLRANTESLFWDGTHWTVKPGNPNAPNAISLSACDVLADPVQWAQSGEEITTRVDVTYQTPGTPDNVEATYSVVNAAAETTYGVHRYGLSTQLSTLADATTVANRVLARSDSVDWRMSGLVWDTALPTPPDTGTANAAMDLLDGTHRLGMPVTITDIPDWSPVGTAAGVYCEGGAWQYTQGRWVLSMNVTPSGNPATGIAWNAAPTSPTAMTWDNTDPAQTWYDMETVGG